MFFAAQKFFVVLILIHSVVGFPQNSKQFAVRNENLITNGQRATPKQFPYQLGLELHMRNKSRWCGATLISDQWALTAAHCTFRARGVTVYLGYTDLGSDQNEDQEKIYVPRANIVVHEEWDFKSITNDISAVKFPLTIQFTDFIQPAMLPLYSSYEGKIAVASGWGIIHDNSTILSRYLRYMEAPVMKNQICRRYFLTAVQPSNLCISTKSGQSPCNGDSGGPLVYRDGTTNYLIGLTSFGIGFGCEKGFPCVFTRITSYLEWIRNVTTVMG